MFGDDYGVILKPVGLALGASLGLDNNDGFAAFAHLEMLGVFGNEGCFSEPVPRIKNDYRRLAGLHLVRREKPHGIFPLGWEGNCLG